MSDSCEFWLPGRACSGVGMVEGLEATSPMKNNPATGWCLIMVWANSKNFAVLVALDKTVLK